MGLKDSDWSSYIKEGGTVVNGSKYGNTKYLSLGNTKFVEAPKYKSDFVGVPPTYIKKQCDLEADCSGFQVINDYSRGRMFQFRGGDCWSCYGLHLKLPVSRTAAQ